MTERLTRPPNATRSVLSLRRILIGLALVGGTYVGAISTYIALGIAPRAAALRQQSVEAIEFVPEIHQVDLRMQKAISDLHMMTSAARTGPQPAPQPMGWNALSESVQWLIDTPWAVETSALMSQSSHEVRAALARAMGGSSRAGGVVLQAMAQLELGDYAGTYRALGRADTLRRDASEELANLRSLALQDLVERQRSLGDAAAGTLHAVWWWFGGGLLMLPMVLVLVHRRFYRPLASLEAGLEQVADGALDTELHIPRRDEMGRLSSHFNAMTAVLRARAEEDQRRAQNVTERLGRLLEDSSHEIYAFDADTLRFVQVNHTACRNLGFDLDDLTVRTPFDIARTNGDPSTTRQSFEDMVQPLRDEKVTQLPFAGEHRRADGTTYPVEGSLQLSKNEEPPVFVAVVQDVTERLRIEQERDRIFEQSVDLLATATLDGRLTRVNPAFEKTLGYPTASFLGRHVLDFVHPDDVDRTKTEMRRIADLQAVRNFEVRCRRIDNTYRWLSWNCDPAEDGVLYAVARDVTDQKEAEAEQVQLQSALQRAAREWTVTFDAIDEPIVLVDDAAHIIRVNETTRALCGLAHGDIVGQPVSALGGSKCWQRMSQLIQSAQRTRRFTSSQVRDEEDRTWNIQVSPVTGWAGRRGAFIVAAHNITPLVQLQDSLRRTETMGAMGALVAGVAHEVRNPLFSMTATLDAFEARSAPRPEFADHLGVLRSQLNRLKLLMQELLEYGKPPTLNLALGTVDGVLQQAVEQNTELADEQGVRLCIKLEEDLPPTRMDHMRLVQVFSNLMANAVQHTPQDGCVTVDAQVIHQGQQHWFESTVADTGTGFQPEDLPHVFEPFFTRRQGGTGLGLALVYRIVEQHGGRISAENGPTGGAVVRVRLPLADTP